MVKTLGFRVNTEAYRNIRHHLIDTDEVNTFSSLRLDIGQVGPGCLTQPGLFHDFKKAQKTPISSAISRISLYNSITGKK